MRVLNVKSNYFPPVEDIPDLVKYDAGEKPFFHVVMFDSPAIGNGTKGEAEYSQSYWQSIVNGMKERNAPLSGGKTGGNGHNAQESDFFTVGALHEPEQNRIFFKIAIPEQGFSTSNEGLIRALKNGVGGFSPVSKVESRIEKGKEYFDAELGVPRIDYVDEGAMKQINYNRSEGRYMALVEQGQVDYNTPSDDIIVNGKVSKRWAVKNQNGPQSRLAGRLLNEMAKKERVMGKDEILQALRNLISTGEISADEVLALVNKKARNEADEKNEQIVEELKEVLGVAEGELKKEVSEVFAEVEATKEVLGLPEDAPVSEIKETVEEVLEEVLDKEVSETAGTDNKKNSARMYVEKEFKRVGFKNLKNAKKALETDAVYLELKNKSEPVQSSVINWR